jgi:hypothetical protein
MNPTTLKLKDVLESENPNRLMTLEHPQKVTMTMED